MKKILLFLLALIVSLQGFANSNAEGYITVDFQDVNVPQGGTGEMVVTWNNRTNEYDQDGELSGFQIEFVLPEGIRLVDAQLGEEIKEHNPAMVLNFNPRKPNGNTSIIAFQTALTPMPTGKCELMKLKFEADPDMQMESYSINTSKIEFAAKIEGSIEACILPDCTFNINDSDLTEAWGSATDNNSVTGISDMTTGTEASDMSADNRCYDLSGRTATSSTRGIVIMQGKKYVRPRR